VIEGGVVHVVRRGRSACEPGEIIMRQMTLADFDYYGLPQARAEAALDALVSVGNIGYYDDGGYLCDRKRDMVISGEVNVYPAEIEGVLIGMEDVRDCAVFGVPDEEYGERLGCLYRS
jgi:long-chain acyl-CoA synthetase